MSAAAPPLSPPGAEMRRPPNRQWAEVALEANRLAAASAGAEAAPVRPPRKQSAKLEARRGRMEPEEPVAVL